MSDLGIWLVVAGAVLLVGLWAFSTWGGRRRDLEFDLEPLPEDPEPLGPVPRIPPRPADDVEPHELADLSGLVATPPPEAPARPRPPARRPREAERHGQRQLELGEAPAEEKQEALPEAIFVLYVTSVADHPIRGPRLAQVLAELGLHHGEMGIYHHHGPGAAAGRPPVFSLANMFEPGSIDPAALQSFETRGLALFMRLPGPLDGAVAFETMLGSAQRIAQQFGAVVQDDTRQRLTPHSTMQLRQRAARYRLVRG